MNPDRTQYAMLDPEPARAVLIDTSRQESDPLRAVQVLLNPNEFAVSTGAEYPTLEIPGLSHRVRQWSHSKECEYSVTLYWSAMQQAREQTLFVLGGRSPGGNLTDVDAAFYIWVMSLTKPIAPGRAPPLIQFFWPGFMWVSGNITSVKTKVQQWAFYGMPMVYSVDVEFFEEKRVFVTSRQFLAQRQSAPEGAEGTAPPGGQPPRRFT